MIHVFTVAAAPRAPEVAVLSSSVAAALPSARFHWVVYGPYDEATAGVLEHGEVQSLEAICPGDRDRVGPTEGKPVGSDPTVAVPDVALSLLRRPGCEGVLFVAPQVVFFSSLPELLRKVSEADVVLVPNVLRPEAATTNEPPVHELRSLRVGVFSISLFAVAPTENAQRFLRWWSDRSHGIVPPQRAGHELRSWLNLAPALFAGIGVLRSSRYLVGRENLGERRLAGEPGPGLTVDGAPLACFDFAGLADGSLEAAIPGSRGDRATLEALVRWYRDQRQAGGPANTPPAGVSAPKER